jgi:hypothetical protein
MASNLKVKQPQPIKDYSKYFFTFWLYFLGTPIWVARSNDWC